MWKFILSLIPWEVIILEALKVLTRMSEKVIDKIVKEAVDFVVEAEMKYGSGKGKEKAKYVDQKLRGILTEASDFLINLLREFAVGYAKRKGLIK